MIISSVIFYSILIVSSLFKSEMLLMSIEKSSSSSYFGLIYDNLDDVKDYGENLISGNYKVMMDSNGLYYVLKVD